MHRVARHAPPVARSPIRRSLLALSGLLSLVPSTARAYDEQVHTYLARAALVSSGLDRPSAEITSAQLDGVRVLIDGWARTATDTAVRAEWLRRYPDPAAFDAWAEKELLLFSPEAQVFGIDRPAPRLPTILDLVEAGSREPDDDRRNRDRLGYDAKRTKLKDADGHDVPADPALLNMGRLGALSSQAHAHYGLASVPLSSDPDVLKEDPRRFAVAASYPPGPVLTLAAEMAQAHLDLSLIAGLADDPSPALAALFTGQAFHYLEDVSNQIHTVQVGIYDFFVDATIERMKMSARTGGGYFGELRSLGSIGIDILTNHHVICEQLTRKRLLEALRADATPEGTRLAAAPKTDDAELASALDAGLRPLGDRPWTREFGLALTRAMIEASSHEGAAVYRVTRAIVEPRYRRAGVLYGEDKDDPDDAVIPPGKRDEKAYSELMALEARAFARAGTAMRLWVGLEQRALDEAMSLDERRALRDRVIGRLVRRQLRLLGEAEARRADYLAHPPPQAAGPERMPAMFAGEAALALVLGTLIARWFRRSRRRGGSLES